MCRTLLSVLLLAGAGGDFGAAFEPATTTATIHAFGDSADAAVVQLRQLAAQLGDPRGHEILGQEKLGRFTRVKAQVEIGVRAGGLLHALAPGAEPRPGLAAGDRERRLRDAFHSEFEAYARAFHVEAAANRPDERRGVLPYDLTLSLDERRHAESTQRITALLEYAVDESKKALTLARLEEVRRRELLLAEPRGATAQLMIPLRTIGFRGPPRDSETLFLVRDTNQASAWRMYRLDIEVAANPWLLTLRVADSAGDPLVSSTTALQGLLGSPRSPELPPRRKVVVIAPALTCYSPTPAGEAKDLVLLSGPTRLTRSLPLDKVSADSRITAQLFLSRIANP